MGRTSGPPTGSPQHCRHRRQWRADYSVPIWLLEYSQQSAGRPRCLYCTQAGCVGFTRDFHPDILGLIMTFNYGLGELNQRGSFQQHVDQ